jgi:hypothetical protein
MSHTSPMDWLALMRSTMNPPPRVDQAHQTRPWRQKEKFAEEWPIYSH